MNTATVNTAWLDWIRPWYPAEHVGHTRPDCPLLLAVQPTPIEGVGWLDPNIGRTCMPCLKADGYPLWDAECRTCSSSLAEEKGWDDSASIFTTKEEAITWKRDHRCEPAVSLVSPQPITPPPPAAQPALFALKDAR